MKLEVVVIPVSDVDRAKEFYAQPRLAARRRLRLRRRLPGRPVHAARLRLLGPVRHEPHVGRARLGPGPLPGRLRHRGRARRARRRAASRSARSSTVGAGLRRSARDAPVASRAGTDAATARSPRSATRTATAGCCRRSRPGCPAASTPPTTSFASAADLASALRRAAAAHGEHEKRTGEADANWPDWYAAYMVRGAGRRRSCRHERLRRDRHRRRLAGRALRRGARRGRSARRASSSASWSAASARTGRASRPRRCCAPARPCTPRATRRRRARGRRRGGARLARLHGLRTTPTPARSAGCASHGIDLLRGTRPARRAGRGRGRRRAPHRRRTSSSRPAPTRSCRRSPACASSRASGRTAR